MNEAKLEVIFDNLATTAEYNLVDLVSLTVIGVAQLSATCSISWNVDVMEFWAWKFSVPQTNIFAGKYGSPLEKSVQVEGVLYKPFFLNRRIENGSNQQELSLGNCQGAWKSLK